MRLPNSMQNPLASCIYCVRLLLEYVAAGNQVIALKQRCGPPSALLAGAVAKRGQARQRLANYHRNHRCVCNCPNKRCGPWEPQAGMSDSVLAGKCNALG